MAPNREYLSNFLNGKKKRTDRVPDERGASIWLNTELICQLSFHLCTQKRESRQIFSNLKKKKKN